MNAFVAILKDSFWSVYSSKILHLSLGAVVLLLLVLAPFGYEQDVAVKVTRNEVTKIGRIFSRLDSARKSEKPSAGKLFWKALTDDQKKRWEKAELDYGQESNKNRRIEGFYRSLLVDLFNDIIQEGNLNKEFQDAQLVRKDETKELINRSDLRAKGKNEQRLSRLLISEVFGRFVKHNSQESCTLTYGYAKIWDTGFSRLMLEGLIREAIPGFLDNFVLSIGLIVAIVITASIIPQMLETGSLYLLLSKPVSRVFLLVSKYIGSTLFVLIFSAALFGGIWALLGLRFQIWMPAFLWSILIYVVIFMIYYSVTMGIGLVFRNAIAAIMVTAGFWLFCFCLSLSIFGLKFYLNFYQTHKVTVVGDVIYRKTPDGKNQYLDASYNWKKAAEGGISLGGGPPVNVRNDFARPVLWKDKNLVLSLTSNADGSSGKPILAATPIEKSGLGTSVEVAKTPNGIIGLCFDSNQQLLAVSNQGAIYKLNGSSLEAIGKKELSLTEKEEKKQKGGSVLGDFFRDIGKNIAKETPKVKQWDFLGKVCDGSISKSEHFQFDAKRNCFFVLQRHKIVKATWEQKDKKYRQTLELPIAWNYKKSTGTPFGQTGNSIIVPLKNGPLVVIDKENLQVKKEFEMKGVNPFSSSSRFNENLFAVAYGRRGVWIFDEAKDSFSMAPGSSGYNCTAVDFDSEGAIVFAQGYGRMNKLSSGSWQNEGQLPVQVDLIVSIYDWIIDPMYQILPKPSECSNLIMHLAKDKDSEMAVDEIRRKDSFNLALENAQISPFKPVISSSIFACFVMLFNCFYFATREY